jgi:hypothetical protein
MLLNGMLDIEKNRFKIKDIMASMWYSDESNCIKSMNIASELERL